MSSPKRKSPTIKVKQQPEQVNKKAITWTVSIVAAVIVIVSGVFILTQ